MSLRDRSLVAFVSESNLIEGILRKPTTLEIEAHQKLLACSDVDTDDLEAFVSVIAPGHVLRRKVGLNVRVGNHIAPPGGPSVEGSLQHILADLLDGDPYEVHQRYEHLHPFTDGNGRSGRALWLWMFDKAGALDKALALGFLHLWYYQSLQAHRTTPPKELACPSK